LSEPGTVDDPLADATRAVIAELNDTHGMALTLQSRCDSGIQSSAWLVVDDEGRPAVLKWRRDGSEAELLGLAAVVERIRRGGHEGAAAWPSVVNSRI